MWFNNIPGNMNFQGKHLEREKTMGRFKHMLSAAGAPWKGSDECLQYIGWLIVSKLMKVPYGWPSMINYFHKNENKGVKNMKLAEALAFCGDRGVYLTALVDMDPRVKKVFLEVLNVSCGLIKKANSEPELKELEKRLAFALTQLEILLPIFWNTSTRHILLHIGRHIRRLGSFWAFSMLGVERYHVTIKNLVRYTLFYTYINLYRCIIYLYKNIITLPRYIYTACTCICLWVYFIPLIDHVI